MTRVLVLADTHVVHLVPGRSLTFTGQPRAFARLAFELTGRFEVRAVEGGTRVTHGYEVAFRRPLM